jgi:hypothetical protein
MAGHDASKLDDASKVFALRAACFHVALAFSPDNTQVEG